MSTSPVVGANPAAGTAMQVAKVPPRRAPATGMRSALAVMADAAGN